MSSIAIPATPALAATGPPAITRRNASIDWLRGVVMVLMALDHVRYFFTNVQDPPEHMEHTSVALFFTRWVTHFCAPSFFFLAGTGAFLSRARSAGTLPSYLIRRGLLLIALELTVIGYAWSFQPGYSFAGVIWALGWSMIILSFLVRAPLWSTALFGGLMVAGHNLLDGISASSFGASQWIWGLLHVAGDTPTPFDFTYYVLYPLVPWVGVMALGYAAGSLFSPGGRSGHKLLALGLAGVAAFLVLRITNVYGNPSTAFVEGATGHFAAQATPSRTLIALLNTEKYPASLQYLLMTLGPALIALAIVGRRFAGAEPGRLNQALIAFGRVPFFYYLCHLFLIHGLSRAMSAMAPSGSARFGLPTVYLLWLLVCVALYFPCRWYAELKQQRRSWIFRYV